MFISICAEPGRNPQSKTIFCGTSPLPCRGPPGYGHLMPEITQVLESAASGDPKAAEEFLPMVYEELRRLAARAMQGESAGHTLQPTALVHEAWMRIAAPAQQKFVNRAHFFGAAAEAMRRILVDHARRRQSLKRGGGGVRVELEDSMLTLAAPPDELVAVSDALERLALEDPQSATLVKLRYFAGMTMEEAAAALGLGKRSAESLWTYARTWLHREIHGNRS